VPLGNVPVFIVIWGLVIDDIASITIGMSHIMRGLPPARASKLEASRWRSGGHPRIAWPPQRPWRGSLVRFHGFIYVVPPVVHHSEQNTIRVFPIDWPRTCRMPAIHPSQFLAVPAFTNIAHNSMRDETTTPFSASIARPTYLTRWRCFFLLSHSRESPRVCTVTVKHIEKLESHQ
jgi:hypothetical protein